MKLVAICWLDCKDNYIILLYVLKTQQYLWMKFTSLPSNVVNLYLFFTASVFKKSASAIDNSNLPSSPSVQEIHRPGTLLPEVPGREGGDRLERPSKPEPETSPGPRNPPASKSKLRGLEQD